MSTVSGSDSTRPPASGVRLTYDDFVQFPEDGERHELIDGEHVVTPSHNMKHQAVPRNLAGLVWSFLRTHKVGQVFFAPFDVVFSDVDVVEPDLLFVSKERQSQILTAAKVYRRTDDRFERVALLSAEQGDVLTSPLFPGLELPLTDVFAE